MPLPLSLAKPIDQPALTAPGAGRLTDSKLPGALNEDRTVLSSIGAAV